LALGPRQSEGLETRVLEGFAASHGR
jgi:hypothetical protein